MTLPIVEHPIYGQIALQTAAWSFPFSWTDQTSKLLSGLSYSEGGRLGTPGSSVVDVGSLTATLKNASTVPSVGDLVRLRDSNGNWLWTGYVQDVSQRIVFDNSVSFTTPNTLTTIYCVDWVGYIAQFQAVGAGGNDQATLALRTTSSYRWEDRIQALNLMIDGTGATDMLNAIQGTSSINLGDTDLVGTFAEHLDLLATSTDAIWWGSRAIPINKTFGRTGLINVYSLSSITPTGKTFTDVAGTSGQLHYTEIDFENTTQNVANSIVANNSTRFHVPDVEVTKIGGFNETNFVVVNNQNVVGVALSASQQKSDSTSITTYGIRQTEVETNVTMPVSSSGSFNLVTNPSVEYSDDGYSGSGSAVTRRRRPADEATPFAAATGSWAMRARIKTAILAPPIVFSGGESDGIPVVPASIYYLYTKAARGATSRTDTRARARVIFYDADEAIISTLYGSQVSLTNSNTWYDVNTAGVTAPAGAVRATVAVEFNRSGGANFTVGDHYWADCFKFGKTTDAYFDGDTAWDATYGYIWTGGVGASPSYKILNYIDNVAGNVLTRYSTTSMRASRIRWNAQEDIAEAYKLAVGKTISLVYKGTTTTYRIIGIDGSIDPERYMIDIYIAKV